MAAQSIQVSEERNYISPREIEAAAAARPRIGDRNFAPRGALSAARAQFINTSIKSTPGIVGRERERGNVAPFLLDSEKKGANEIPAENKPHSPAGVGGQDKRRILRRARSNPLRNRAISQQNFPTGLPPASVGVCPANGTSSPQRHNLIDRAHTERERKRERRAWLHEKIRARSLSDTAVLALSRRPDLYKRESDEPPTGSD